MSTGPQHFAASVQCLAEQRFAEAHTQALLAQIALDVDKALATGGELLNADEWEQVTR